MKHLKPYLSYFSSIYSICGGVGLLLQKFFSIYTAMGALMFAATALTAFRFVKHEHRAPTKAEQHYLAKYCTIHALFWLVAFGVLFLVFNAFHHGTVVSALFWLKVALWDGWWVSAIFLIVCTLTNWGISLFNFGFLARKHAEKRG